MLTRIIPATLLALGLAPLALADDVPQIDIDQALPTDLVLYDLNAERIDIDDQIGEQPLVLYMLGDDHLNAMGDRAASKEQAPPSPAHAALQQAQGRFGDEVKFVVVIQHPIKSYTLPNESATETIAGAIHRQRQQGYARLAKQLEACKEFDAFTVWVDEGGAMAARLGADPATPAIVLADAKSVVRFADVEGEHDGQADELIPALEALLAESTDD